MKLSALASQVINRAENSNRHIVAIAGPPAAGKSTVAHYLCEAIKQLNVSCVVVPMDGFHLDNAILESKGLLNRKGAPETFDAWGFAHLVTRIANGESPIYSPVFDRQRDIAIAGAEVINAESKIVLVEGNYLLLGSDPWSSMHQYWDTKLFINTDLSTIEERILDRWLQLGLDFSDAIDKARDNDIPNAKFVLEHSLVQTADILIDEIDLKS